MSLLYQQLNYNTYVDQRNRNHDRIKSVSGRVLLILTLLYTSMFADGYLLVMSKDDAVCKHMRELYDGDLFEKSRIVLTDHSEYSWLAWREKLTFKKDRVAGGELLSYQKETFDINNDGQDETVLFRRTNADGGTWYQYDYLSYIKDGYQVNPDDDMVLRLNTEKRLVNLSGDNSYKLKSFPEDNYLAAFLIRPFRFEKKYYLSLFGNLALTHSDLSTQKYFENDINTKNAIVITQYDKNNTLRDICYFIRPQPVTTYKGDKK